MNPIKIVVLGHPLAQKRHRTFRAKGKVAEVAGDKFGNIHIDPSSGDKLGLQWQIVEHRPEKPIDAPVRIDCYFYFPRPKSHYGTGKNSGVLKANAPVWYFSKPDRDNLDKFVLDAMKGIILRDDCYACAGEIEKKYSEQPRTEIVITFL